MNVNENLIERAKEYATHAHASIDQKRKYTGEDYITHPTEVARIVSFYTYDPEIIASAWLHDVVEDVLEPSFGRVKALEMIREEFGERVASLVENLSDVAKKENRPDLNRAERKKLNREHSKLAHKDAKLVKLADLLHNLSDVEKSSPEFARTYFPENRLLVDEALSGPEMQGELLDIVNRILDDYLTVS